MIGSASPYPRGMPHKSLRLPRWSRHLKPVQAGVLVVAVAIALTVLRTCETKTPGSLADARARQLSNVWIETEGTVKRLLPDDREGDRHQRLLLDVGGGDTLLVVHNIDVAERVPAREGDEIQVKGEYVWNEKGGLIHWTHRDSDNRQAGGWVRHAGRTYR